MRTNVPLRLDRRRSAVVVCWIDASNSCTHMFFWGYALSAALMVGAAAAEVVLGVKAERQSLESISTPLQAR